MSQPRFDIVRLGTVDSTQRIARDRAREGAPSGTVIVAAEQTQGRGRNGRRWYSPAEAGVWLTWIHRSRRPPEEWPAITSAGALAVSAGIRRLGIDSYIRWPNDVIAAGGKLAGVLADVEGDALLLGVGVNHSLRREDLPEELHGIATSISDEGGWVADERPNLDATLDLMVDEIAEVLRRFEEGGPREIVREVWLISSVRNRSVQVELPEGDTIVGRAVGLGPLGEILVDHGHPNLMKIANGRLVSLEES